MLSKVAATGKYQDNNIDHSQWSHCFEELNNQDHFSTEVNRSRKQEYH